MKYPYNSITKLHIISVISNNLIKEFHYYLFVQKIHWRISRPLFLQDSNLCKVLQTFKRSTLAQSEIQFQVTPCDAFVHRKIFLNPCQQLFFRILA